MFLTPGCVRQSVWESPADLCNAEVLLLQILQMHERVGRHNAGVFIMVLAGLCRLLTQKLVSAGSSLEAL